MDTGTTMTVIFSMIAPRGRVADHVRTWTHGQTLARERYRVVVGSDGTDPAQEREVEALLGRRDEPVRVPGAVDAALWNAGAARAGTPWLVFTEGHCRADARCLEAIARWIAAGPTAPAANLTVDHDEHSRLSRLSHRWFDETHEGWRRPGEWPRLYRAGSVIRADAFAAAGGFEPRYGQFAVPLLSARLHAIRLPIESIADAVVVHGDAVCMREHHDDMADYVRGEMDARSVNDPVFFERYFGHAALWANRLRYRWSVAGTLVRAVAVSAMTRPHQWRALAGCLGPLGLAPLSPGPRAAWARLLTRLDRVLVDRAPMPDGWLWKRYRRAHARVIRLAQIEWMRRQFEPEPARRGLGRWPIETLGPETIVGVHALEEHGGRRFRWTEPVALIRLIPPRGDHELRLETGGLRGDPLAALIAVIVGGRPLPSALLGRGAGETLTIRLPQAWSAAAARGIVLVARPLVPPRRETHETRRLGLPVLSVTLAAPGAP